VHPKNKIYHEVTKDTKGVDVMLVHETGLGERMIGLGIEVQRALGPGLLESLYEDCLCQ